MSAGTRIGLDTAASSGAAIGARHGWALRLEQAIERGADHLLSLQAEQGYWLGELEADSTLESDYIYYLYVLGKADPSASLSSRTMFDGNNCRTAGGIFIPVGRPS